MRRQNREDLNKTTAEKIQNKVSKIGDNLKKVMMSIKIFREWKTKILVNKMKKSLEDGNIYYFKDLKILNPEEYEKLLPELKNSVTAEMKKCLEDGKKYYFKDLKNLNILNQAEYEKLLPELKNSVIIGMKKSLENGNIDYFNDLKNLNILNQEEVQNSKELKNPVTIGMKKSLENVNISNFEDLKDLNILNQEEYEKLLPELKNSVTAEMKKCLEGGSVFNFNKLKDLNILNQEEYEKLLSELKNPVTAEMKKSLEDGKNYYFKDLKNLNILNKEEYEKLLPELKNSVIIGMKKSLEAENISNFEDLKNLNILNQEEIQNSKELKNSVTAEMKKCLEDGKIFNFKNLKDLNILNQEEIQNSKELKNSVTIRMKKTLEDGNIYNFKDLKNLKILNQEEYEKLLPELKNPVTTGMKKCLEVRSISNFKNLKNLNILNQEEYEKLLPELKNPVTTGMKKCLENGNIDYFNDSKNLNILNPEEYEKLLPELKNSVTTGMKKSLKDENIFDFKNLKDLNILNPEEEKKLLPELKNSITTGMKKDLEGGSISNFNRNLKELNILNQEEYEKLLPELKNLVTTFLKQNFQKPDFDYSVFFGDKYFLDNDIKKTILNKKEKDEKLNLKFLRVENMQKLHLLKKGEYEIDKNLLEKINSFKKKYGEKGETISYLCMYKYGVENVESVIKNLNHIENIVDKYNFENIPAGYHTSIGFEYEVSKSILEDYPEFKNDIVNISKISNIGLGKDALHEIAVNPSYNPYLILAEAELLNESGFVDFNFKKYKKLPRGAHISIVGENGLDVNQETYFLNNLLSGAQLTGILSGKEINDTKDVHKKDFNIFDNSKQKGYRVEFKGMGMDGKEQFEKSILYMHNAGIAIQIYEKYKNNLKEIKTEKEKKIFLEWEKLKMDTEKAILNHNNFFYSSEFEGFYFNEKEEYIETEVDTKRNLNLLEEQKISKENLEEKSKINLDCLYKKQNPNFVNALIYSNNVFLKGYLNNQADNSNAMATLSNMKSKKDKSIMEGDYTQSIFDTGEMRDGYYNFQGASENFISHKLQILLSNFNHQMEKIFESTDKNIEKEKDQEQRVI